MKRRQLLQLLALGASAPLGLSLMNQALADSTSLSSRKLILIELAGANDGLNTLVPMKNDFYFQYRPGIALSKNEVTNLDDQFSMHQSLNPLMKYWEQGSMAWVHGLGYPAPNRSHFKSISLWETGGDGNRDGKQGWVTHDIEHRLGRSINDAHGISMVGDMNLFRSDSGRWLSMSSPEQFLDERQPVSMKTSNVNRSLTLVTQRMAELEESLYGLSSKLENSPGTRRLPGGTLGAQLQQVLRMIRAKIDTPVFRVQLDGFDTHENQPYRHRNLLDQLGKALAAFATELQKDGEWNNTLIMTYSEFGRRAKENRSGGTDHGTAAPHMILGGKINGGLFGNPTDLAKLDATGDPHYTMDYRALYNRVLNQWFDIPQNTFSAWPDRRLDRLIG